MCPFVLQFMCLTVQSVGRVPFACSVVMTVVFAGAMSLLAMGVGISVTLVVRYRPIMVGMGMGTTLRV